MPWLVKGGADHHGLLRLLGQLNVGVQGLPAPEVLHVGVEKPPVLLPAEEKRVALAARSAVPLRRAGGHPRRPHGHQAHGAFGNLGVLPKIQQRDGVQPHIAVVRDGQRQAKLAVHDQIVVPLLDPQRGRLDLVPVVHRQQLFGETRLPQVALPVQQRPRLRDLMLFHNRPPPFIPAYYTVKILFLQLFSSDFKNLLCHKNGNPPNVGQGLPLPYSIFSPFGDRQG